MSRLLLAAVLALTLAAPAAAGGWATVQLSSLPQDREWSGELTVLQHGRTPLDGLAPVIRVTGDDGSAREFPATPAGETGVYRFAVRFPAEGTYEYEIWDGFSRTHTYRAVTVGGSGEGLPWLAGTLAAALAAAALAAVVLLLRRRAQARPAGAPALP